MSNLNPDLLWTANQLRRTFPVLKCHQHRKMFSGEWHHLHTTKGDHMILMAVIADTNTEFQTQKLFRIQDADGKDLLPPTE